MKPPRSKSKAMQWRVTVRKAEVRNPLGSLPMTLEEPFGAHEDPERFAGSVVRVQRAGGPPLTGVVERTPQTGRAVWVTLLAAGDKLRSRRFLGREVVVVLSEVDRSTKATPALPTENREGRQYTWGLARTQEIFATARKVVEYKHERGGGTTEAVATGEAVFTEWQRRRRARAQPIGRLKYLGASRYRLAYGPKWWIDFEGDPP